MKHPLNLTMVAIVVALAALFASVWRPETPVKALSPSPAAANCDASRSIQTTGTAVINVTPDRVLINLGVQSNGATADGVHTDNIRAIQKVITALKGMGIDPKDIATDYYIVQPVYDDYNSLNIKGYRVDNTVSVTLRDVKLIDTAILSALKAGANEVQDVQFYTSELRKYRDQARDLAMKAAGEKAQALAQAAGAQTGCVLSASENNWSTYYGSWRGGRNAAIWTQNVAQNAPQNEAPQPEDLPISLGQIAIQSQINASYSLQ
jgi:uncharacterized protein